MPYFTSPNERLVGPLPRRDILAVCAYLGRRQASHQNDDRDGPLTYLDRLAAAARMQ
jgi:hypothetical protein